MNFETIKKIYKMVLIYNRKIEYLGNDEYRLTEHYQDGQKMCIMGFKNGTLHGEHTDWYANGALRSNQKWKNGKQVK